MPDRLRVDAERVERFMQAVGRAAEAPRFRAAVEAV